MPTIKHLDAFEILDSRGRPTIEVVCSLASGSRASAQVPSGASTGSAEARELRDRDPRRHAGLGCRRAAAQVTGEIRGALSNRNYPDQQSLDESLLALDGTPDKGRLGANSLLGVSLAFARAHALERQVPLYRHFADMVGRSLTWIPRPTINLFSGGKHAGGQVALQDVLVLPVAAKTMDDALVDTCAVYQAAVAIIATRYRARALVADEGGLAPPFPNAEAMLTDAVDAVHHAGLGGHREVVLAVDVASSHFFEGDHYLLDGRELNSAGMIARLEEWVSRFPIVSLEDGLAEDDWGHWPELVRRLGARITILGDDFLCTNPDRIRRAAELRAANALLLKVNQIGTLSEAADAWRLASSHHWQITISARSGETEDHWLADLATGWGAHHIKIGSVSRSERLAKYNRLLAIERETGLSLYQAGKENAGT